MSVRHSLKLCETAPMPLPRSITGHGTYKHRRKQNFDDSVHRYTCVHLMSLYQETPDELLAICRIVEVKLPSWFVKFTPKVGCILWKITSRNIFLSSQGMGKEGSILDVCISQKLLLLKETLRWFLSRAYPGAWLTFVASESYMLGVPLE